MKSARQQRRAMRRLERRRQPRLRVTFTFTLEEPDRPFGLIIAAVIIIIGAAVTAVPWLVGAAVLARHAWTRLVH